MECIVAQVLLHLSRQLEVALGKQKDDQGSAIDFVWKASIDKDDPDMEMKLVAYMQNARIESQGRDFSYRLCVLSAQQLGADPQGLNCAAAGTQSASAAPRLNAPMTVALGSSLPPIMPNSVVPSSGTTGRGPGTLGTLAAAGPPAGARLLG